MFFFSFLTASPWPLLATIAWTIALRRLTRTRPFIMDIAAISLVHFLFYRQSSFVLILKSVLILNGIPFLSIHLAYFLSPQMAPNLMGNPWRVVPRPKLWQFVFLVLAFSYLYSVTNFFVSREIEAGIREMQNVIGIILEFFSLYCLLGHLPIELPRRFREAQVARDIRVIGGFGGRTQA